MGMFLALSLSPTTLTSAGLSSASFGTVYRARLDNAQPVAVKMVSVGARSMGPQSAALMNEVKLMSWCDGIQGAEPVRLSLQALSVLFKTCAADQHSAPRPPPAHCAHDWRLPTAGIPPFCSHTMPRHTHAACDTGSVCKSAWCLPASSSCCRPASDLLTGSLCSMSYAAGALIQALRH